MNEADDAAEWVRIMANRYNWGGDLDVLITEAEALGQTDGSPYNGCSNICTSRGS